MIAQAARPAATPAFAERVTVAAASASADTAVIGISQPKVTAADSGYAHRDPGAWALPLRAAGAQLIQDLHPHDRGPKGTHDGAIISGGSLHCPCTPRLLPGLGPLARPATREQATTHDTSTAELARYKLGRLTRDHPDGYHRVQCPPARGKIRCQPQPSSEKGLCQPSSGRNTSGTPTWPSPQQPMPRRLRGIGDRRGADICRHSQAPTWRPAPSARRSRRNGGTPRAARKSLHVNLPPDGGCRAAPLCAAERFMDRRWEASKGR